MAHHGFAEQIAASIEQTLLDQARRNELIIAYVRASTLVLVAGADWLAHSADPLGYPARVPMFASGWAVLSFVLAIALRCGWYRPSLRVVIPLADGLVLAGALANFTMAVGHRFAEFGGVVSAALGCALFAATGALRLSRLAAAVTAIMGLMVFALVVLLSWAWSRQTVVHFAALVGMGLLGVWLTDVVRRAMHSEAGRTALQRFLPSEIVREALASEPSSLLALVTEPRSVDATIVVTDLRDFTSLAEQLSPAAVLDVLNEIQGALADAVVENGGTVDKFLGDGMLAVFGAPTPLEAHAARAVASARTMKRSLELVNASRRERGLVPLRLGIGVHSGTVVTGCLGSGTRLEFTVIGDTVNVATRLQALTKQRASTC